jgi:hypothetical protein
MLRTDRNEIGLIDAAMLGVFQVESNNGGDVIVDYRQQALIDSGCGLGAGGNNSQNQKYARCEKSHAE